MTDTTTGLHLSHAQYGGSGCCLDKEQAQVLPPKASKCIFVQPTRSTTKSRGCGLSGWDSQQWQLRATYSSHKGPSTLTETFICHPSQEVELNVRQTKPKNQIRRIRRPRRHGGRPEPGVRDSTYQVYIPHVLVRERIDNNNTLRPRQDTAHATYAAMDSQTPRGSRIVTVLRRRNARRAENTRCLQPPTHLRVNQASTIDKLSTAFNQQKRVFPLSAHPFCASSWSSSFAV